MKTQHDSMQRVVLLENLHAMCKHVSVVAHRFWVEKVTRSRVHVGYSNPDECGSEHPMYAVFPCYPGYENDNPHIVMDLQRVIRDTLDGDGWQAFDPLTDCPQLYRGTDGIWVYTKCPKCNKELRNEFMAFDGTNWVCPACETPIVLVTANQ